MGRSGTDFCLARVMMLLCTVVFSALAVPALAIADEHGEGNDTEAGMSKECIEMR